MRRKKVLRPDLRTRKVRVFVYPSLCPLWWIEVVSGNGRLLERRWLFATRKGALADAQSLALVYSADVEERPWKRKPRPKADRRQLVLDLPAPAADQAGEK